MDLRNMPNEEYMTLMREKPALMARELVRLRVRDLLEDTRMSDEVIDFFTMGIKIVKRDMTPEQIAKLEETTREARVAQTRLADEIQKLYDAMIAEDFLNDLPITPISSNEGEAS